MTSGWQTRDSERASSTRNVAIIVAGNAYTVKGNSNFAETVKKLAKKENLTRFHVYVDGEEILDPAQAPRDFRSVESEVKVSAYNKAGY